MKITLNKNCIYAAVDTNGKEVDVKQIRKIVKALELLGKTVTSIMLSEDVCCTMDTSFSECKHYGRFPDAVMEKAYNQLASWLMGQTEVHIKGNRLYMNVDGYEIVLPKYMYSNFDTHELSVWIYYE